MKLWWNWRIVHSDLWVCHDLSMVPTQCFYNVLGTWSVFSTPRCMFCCMFWRKTWGIWPPAPREWYHQSVFQVTFCPHTKLRAGSKGELWRSRVSWLPLALISSWRLCRCSGFHWDGSSYTFMPFYLSHHTNVSICVYTYIHIYTYRESYLNVCTYVYIYIIIYVYIYICIYMYIYICIYIYMYIYICIYI